MKPVVFHYERPGTLEGATALLAEEGVFAKAVAGSQSLGPMMNLRLAQPDLLVDVTTVPELLVVTDSRDYIEIGACITHADIEDRRVPDVTCGLLPHVGSRIAYRAIRNRGTVGGSLAHADPAADWISIFPLLGAEAVTRARHRTRRIAIADLLLSSFSTALEANELIQTIRIPKLSDRARWGYYKFSHKAGEFAHAIGAVLHDPEHDLFRAVIGAIETAPIVVPDAATVFQGAFGPRLGERLDEEAALRLLDQKGVSDDYIRRLSLVALRRAAEQACA